MVPVAAAVLLPGAIANLLDAISAWQHAALPPKDAVLAPRNLSAKLLTNDHNLGKLAELQKVSYLNMHELSKALKPILLPSG